MSPSIDWGAILPAPPTGPALYWRHRWNEYRDKFGLPYSRGHMQNLDSERRGPERRVFGNRIAYERQALVDWLNEMGKRGVAA